MQGSPINASNPEALSDWPPGTIFQPDYLMCESRMDHWGLLVGWNSMDGLHLRPRSLWKCGKIWSLGLIISSFRARGNANPPLFSAVLETCKQNTLPLPLFPSAKVSSSTTMLLHRLTCLSKVHLNGRNFHLFPRIIVTRKRRTNSTFWHHF